MARVSDELVNKIIQSNDIADVISNFIELQRKGQSYVAICPFHNDTNPSMSIDTRLQIFKCFVCNTGGNCLRFLMLFKKWNFLKSLDYLAERAGISFNLSDYEYQPKENLSEKDLSVYDILERANSFYKSELVKTNDKDVKQFLEKRDLSYEICKDFDIGFALESKFKKVFKTDLKENLNILADASLVTISGDEIFFKNRITFGIRDEQNRVIGFSARVLDGSKPKYINSAESKYFKKSNILYNLNNALTTQLDYLLIAEGFFDVIALSKIGYTSTVCLMGTALTKNHINKIKRFKKIIFFLDGDDAGREATYKNLRILIANNIKNIYVVENKTELDPDDLLKTKGEKHLKNIVDNSLNCLYFIYDYLRIKHGLYDGKKILELTNIKWENFGSEIYPIWKSLDKNSANVLNEIVKKDYKKDLNLILDKSKSLENETFKSDKVTSKTEFIDYDEPPFPDTAYFDSLVNSQTYPGNLTNINFNEPKLAQKHKYKASQNWIEKMLIVVLNYPDLIKLFKKKIKRNPLKSIFFEETEYELDEIYNYLKDNEVFRKADVLKRAAKFKEAGRDGFLKDLSLDNKDLKQLSEDFNDIFNRASKIDLQLQNEFMLIKSKDAMKANEDLSKNVLELARENKIKLEDDEDE